MSSKKSDIRRQFDRNASSYDAHAKVQRMMANQLLQYCSEWEYNGSIADPNILEIGCGTGVLTQRLAEHWSRASITALDIAPAMIEAASLRVGSTIRNNFGTNKQPIGDRMQFLQADVELWAAEAPTASFDLIVSNACFQWLNDPENTLGHLRRMLRPEGKLIFTTFGPDTFYELHQSFGEVYKSRNMEPQRHGLSFRSTSEWSSMLMRAGFSSIHCQSNNHMEKYASVRNFLHSVKSMGASTSEASATKGISSRHLFNSMYQVYEERFSLEGGVKATYDLLLIQSSR